MPKNVSYPDLHHHHHYHHNHMTSTPPSPSIIICHAWVIVSVLSLYINPVKGASLSIAIFPNLCFFSLLNLVILPFTSSSYHLLGPATSKANLNHLEGIVLFGDQMAMIVWMENVLSWLVYLFLCPLQMSWFNFNVRKFGFWILSS